MAHAPKSMSQMLSDQKWHNDSENGTSCCLMLPTLCLMALLSDAALAVSPVGPVPSATARLHGLPGGTRGDLHFCEPLLGGFAASDEAVPLGPAEREGRGTRSHVRWKAIHGGR